MVAQVNRSIMHPVQIVQGVSNAPYAYRSLVQWFDCINFVRAIDPCMGSGHILVYAFDVLIDIYRSCGWGERDAAKSILRNNLYGLDIDRRAYQLAYFAVMMKARQYNRRICSPENQPNLANFADVMGADTDMLSGSIRRFAEQFAFADTYGSLMTVTAPADIDTAFSDFMPTFGLNMRQFDMMMKIYKILSQKYDVVCTNPPYMGGSGMNVKLSEFVKSKFPDYKSDLFSTFVIRCTQLCKAEGYLGFLTPYVWMFIQSYEKCVIISIVHAQSKHLYSLSILHLRKQLSLYALLH